MSFSTIERVFSQGRLFVMDGFENSSYWSLVTGGLILMTSSKFIKKLAQVSRLRPSPIVGVEKILQDGGKHLTCSDGRTLEYFEFGSTQEDAKVLVGFHGVNTTGKLFKLWEPWAAENNVRIIAPSLPGWGMSSPWVGVDLTQYVETHFSEFIKEIQVTQLYVVGLSMGSLVAAHVAGLYRDRAAIKGVEFYAGFVVTKEHPDPFLNAIAMFRFFRWLYYNHPFAFKFMHFGVTLPLFKLFMSKENDVRRSMEYYWEGAIDSLHLFGQQWPFELDEISDGGAVRRRVVVVSGSGDVNAPVHNQEYLHAKIPDSTLVTYQGDHMKGILDPKMSAGHFELLWQ